MRRLTIIITVTVFAALGLVPLSSEHDGHHGHSVAEAQSSDPICTAFPVPLGALAGQPKPIWCHQPLAPDSPTFVNGVNSWVDDFDHGATLAELGVGYVQEFRGDGRGLHWRHGNHWMVDLQAITGPYSTMFAAFMRPDRTFRKQADGSVVIEMEVATPIAGTRDTERVSDSWPELIISTASSPTTMNPWGSWLRQNGTYLYEAFPNGEAFGCRVQQSRHPICAYYQKNVAGTPNYAGGPDRLWEINQNGTDVLPGSEYGGDPSTAGLDAAWATCSSSDDPDTKCRNLFRFTLSDQHVRIDVKKPGGSYVRYYEASPEDASLGKILNASGGFYVYFGDFAYRFTDDTVIRFHWDRLAVNPAAGGTPPTPTVTPLVTPTTVPTAGPTSTPAPTQTPPTGTTRTVTFDDRAGQNQVMSGQYGGIDWGAKNWYHAAPFGKLTTKNVSFNGGGVTSASFTLINPSKLVKLDAYNGGSGASTVTLACAGQPTKTATVAAGQLTTIQTGWTGTCQRVTITSSNGWKTNFDNLALAAP